MNKIILASILSVILLTTPFASVSAQSPDAQKSKKDTKITITYKVTGTVGQKAIILFKACNFSQINPEFRINSDAELGFIYKLSDGMSYNNSCTPDMMIMVKAKDPKSIQIKLEPRDKAGSEPKIIIKTISPTKMPDRFQVVFKICAANKILQNPTVYVESDETEQLLSVISRIGKGSCQTRDVMVFATDPSTIKFELLTDKKSVKSEPTYN